MSRLIDADPFREWWLENGENEYVYDTNCFLESIDEQPTIDAVPVVRCKDCKWWKKAGCAFDTRCKEDIPKADDFCSYGERKDKEANKR